MLPELSNLGSIAIAVPPVQPPIPSHPIPSLPIGPSMLNHSIANTLFRRRAATHITALLLWSPQTLHTNANIPKPHSPARNNPPLPPSFLLPHLPRAIQIERRTNKRQMTKRLRRIAQLLSRTSDFLGEHAEMVAEGEHVLENACRLLQVFLFVFAGLFLVLC